MKTGVSFEDIKLTGNFKLTREIAVENVHNVFKLKIEIDVTKGK